MPPSDDDDDGTKARLAAAVEAMTDLARSKRQTRLAEAINGVPEIARWLAAHHLRDIADHGVRDFKDMETAAFLAAVVHDDATWDAVVQVRQIIEALRGKKDQP